MSDITVDQIREAIREEHKGLYKLLENVVNDVSGLIDRVTVVEKQVDEHKDFIRKIIDLLVAGIQFDRAQSNRIDNLEKEVVAIQKTLVKMIT